MLGRTSAGRGTIACAAAVITRRTPTNDLDALESMLVPATLSGLDVLDVGCGDGGLVRWLNARGARARGVEVSEPALERARSVDALAASDYLVGGAQALPLRDSSVDLVTFWRSLHHVPPPAMAMALSEARRVLRPNGLLYVAEPLAHGSFFELLRRVDDETKVRALAQRHLTAAAAGPGFACERTIEYEVTVRIADLAQLRVRVVGAAPARAARFDAVSAELQRAAETLSQRAEKGWTFRQPMRADLLRRRDGDCPNRVAG